VVGWVRTTDEAAAWAALDRLPELSDLESWHDQEDVAPFSLLADGRLVGYGELWEDRDLDEAELARLVIAPALRGQGHGRALTRLLADEALRRGFREVWLRVLPENAPARRAYEAAGFVRATSGQEAEFNSGQPRTYVWMRDPGPP
jgi:RimJ/RimL family protein N-acetyltransferase